MELTEAEAIELYPTAPTALKAKFIEKFGEATFIKKRTYRVIGLIRFFVSSCKDNHLHEISKGFPSKFTYRHLNNIRLIR